MSLAHYLLQVNIYLVIFYAFYKIGLAKETYFTINRIYLVASGFLSMAIPFIRLDYFAKQEIRQQVFVGLDQLMAQATVITEVEQHFKWGNFLAAIYVLGVMCALVLLLFKLLHIKKLFKAIGDGSAFSFMHKKVVGNDLPEQLTISHHEEIHVKQLHTVDVLFFEILTIINWFNPIIYLYKIAIKNIHEYLADEAAAKFQGDKETYALLLLSHALKVSPNTLTNSFFNKGMLKKRIYMLHKQRSKKVAILKYGLFVPLFALALLLSSSTISKNEEILAVADQIPLTDFEDVKTAINSPIEAVKSIKTNIETNQLKTKNNDMKSIIKTALIVATTAFATSANAQTDTAKKELTLKEVSIMAYEPKDSINKIGNLKLKTAEGKEPLYVVDGIPVVKEKFSSISPNSIEDIEVLKDKAAIALYGDKGRNGVILIATKLEKNNPEYQKRLAERKKKQALEAEQYKNALVVIDGVEQKERGLTGIHLSSIMPLPTSKFLKDKAATDKYGEKGKDGVIEVTTKPKTTVSGKNLQGQPASEVTQVLQGKVVGLANKSQISTSINIPTDAYILLDKKSITKAEMDQLDPNKINNIEVLRDKAATTLYGSKGKNGVVLITSAPNVTYSLKSSTGQNLKVGHAVEENATYSFSSMEKQPTFPGGIAKFYKMISDNLKYPSEAIKNNIQGKVFTSFTIEKDGSLSDFKVERKLGYGTDEEAIRVLKLSPKWEPGTQKGKPVRVRYNISISFGLQK